MEGEAIIKLVQSIRAEIGNNGRVIFRPSSIDNVVRIMVECGDALLCQKYADRIKDKCLTKLETIS